MKRTRPNYERAKKLAYEALERHMVADFPIDIFSIFKSYPDIKIITYSEMASKRNCTIEEIIEANSSEDGVIHYSADRDKYLISYNDTVGHKERVYWTLAHEYGHYKLGHHKESDKSNLARSEMSLEEYDVQEVEANFFARFFLSPPPIIVATEMNHHSRIMDFFGVSYTSATNTLSYIGKSRVKGYGFSIPNRIFELLQNFIKKVTLGVTCSNCRCFFCIEDANYCPVCGGNDLHIFFKGDDFDMKYPVIEMDYMDRSVECPNCKNEEIIDDYCHICGSYLVNKCTGLYPGESEEYSRIQWHDFTRGCGNILVGNARFCSKCGSASTFYETGILKHWNQPSQELNENRLQLVSSNGKNIDISDDDLPF
jgi:Zn-dependent peptidase ImmA (M78 family)